MEFYQHLESVRILIEVGQKGWLIPVAGGHAQAQCVWAAFAAPPDEEGELFMVSSSFVVAAEGAPGSVEVTLEDGLPSSVEFQELAEEDLARLVESVGRGSPVKTFSVLGGTWPSAQSASDACPHPVGQYPLVLYFSRPDIYVSLDGADPELWAPGGPEGEGALAIVSAGYHTAAESAEGAEAPVEAAGRGRGAGAGATGRPRAQPGPRVKSPSVAAAKAAQQQADLVAAVQAAMAPLTHRLEALEAHQRAPHTGVGVPTGAPPGLGIPGVGFLGGPPATAGSFFGVPKSGGADGVGLGALHNARSLLGVGAGRGGGLLSAPAARPLPDGLNALRPPPARPTLRNPARPAEAGGHPRGGASTPQPPTAGLGGATDGLSGCGAILGRIANALEQGGGLGSNQGVSLDEAYGLPQGGAQSSEEYQNLMGSVGAAGLTSGLSGVSRHSGVMAMERIKLTRRSRPDVVIQASEMAARENSRVQPGEQWSWSLHAVREDMPAAGNFLTLKRMLAVIAAALDEGRVHGLQQEHAFLHHAYKMLKDAAHSPGHDMQWGWPILGIPDPGGRAPASWAPAENAALQAFHRDAAALESAKKALNTGNQRYQGGEGGGKSSEEGGEGPRPSRAALRAAARKAAGPKAEGPPAVPK